MATFQTPIGKVRYSGNHRYVVAVPNPRVSIGTSVVKRSNSALTAAREACRFFDAVVVDTSTGTSLS